MEFKQTDELTIPELMRIGNLINDLPGKIKATSAKQKRIVFVLGNTCAGKSTTIDYLLECEIQKNEFLGSYTAIPIPIAGRKFAPVGHDTVSQTLYPEAYDAEKDCLRYYDCPGFADNRGRVERICASIGTEVAIKAAGEAESIVIMVVIELGSLVVEHGDSFKKLGNTVGKLLENSSALSGSILFVFTKCPSTVQKQEVMDRLKKIIPNDQLGAKVIDLIIKNDDNVILLDVFDNGQSRKYITEKLKKLKPVSQEVFGFNYDADREIFNNTVLNIVKKGRNMMDTILKLQERLYDDSQTLTECKENLSFYDEQILEFSSNSSVQPNKATSIALFKQQLELIGRGLERANSSLTALNKEIAADKAELANIDTAKPYLYWFGTVDEPRWRWFGVESAALPTQTRKLFEYPYKLPIAKVKLYPPKQIKSYPHPLNGGFTVFQEDRERGIYKAQYESERRQDGYAKIKIYIEERNRPENASYIPQLRKTLARAENEDKVFLEHQIKRLRLEAETYQSAIVGFEKESTNFVNLTEQQIINLQSAQRTNKETFDKLSDEIPNMQTSLRELQLDFYAEYVMYLMSFSDVLDPVAHKAYLDKYHQSEMPMLIQYGALKTIWLYWFDAKQENDKLKNTKLIQLSDQTDQNLYEGYVFKEKSVAISVKASSKIFRHVSDFVLAKGYLSLVNRQRLFLIIDNIANVINKKSALMNSFSKVLELLKTPNQYGSELFEESINDECNSLELINCEDDSIKTKDLICPITLGMMADPVIANCGHSFERTAITKYCGKEGKACPCCKQTIHKNDLRPNINLKNYIAEWRKRKEEKFKFFQTPLPKTDSFFCMNDAEKEQKTKVLKESKEHLTNKLEKTAIKISQLTARQSAIDEILATRKVQPQEAVQVSEISEKTSSKKSSKKTSDVIINFDSPISQSTKSDQNQSILPVLSEATVDTKLGDDLNRLK